MKPAGRTGPDETNRCCTRENDSGHQRLNGAGANSKARTASDDGEWRGKAFGSIRMGRCTSTARRIVNSSTFPVQNLIRESALLLKRGQCNPPVPVCPHEFPPATLSLFTMGDGGGGAKRAGICTKHARSILHTHLNYSDCGGRQSMVCACARRAFGSRDKFANSKIENARALVRVCRPLKFRIRNKTLVPPPPRRGVQITRDVYRKCKPASPVKRSAPCTIRLIAYRPRVFGPGHRAIGL